MQEIRKRKICKRALTAVIVSAMLLASACASEKGTSNKTADSETVNVSSAPSGDTSAATELDETDTSEMTIEKVQKMNDPAQQYEATVTLFDNIKDDQAGNIKDAAELLLIMSKYQCGNGIVPNSDLLTKLDKFLETYHGQYFIIPVNENGVATFNDFYMKEYPITMYDENGKAIIDYYVNTGLLTEYHCQSASHVSKSFWILQADAFTGGADTDFINLVASLESDDNEDEYQFSYDDLGRLIQMKWKVYPLKEDKQGNLIVSKNQYKMAQYDFTYQDNGFLLSAVRSGYDYDYGDKVTGYVECDWQYSFGSYTKITLEAMSLDDGSCLVKGVAKSNKKAKRGEQPIQTHVSGMVYYDLKEQISSIYINEDLGNGIELWRKINFEYKSKGDIRSITEAFPAQVIYTGKDRSANAWTEDQTKEFLFEYLY